MPASPAPNVTALDYEDPKTTAEGRPRCPDGYRGQRSRRCTDTVPVSVNGLGGVGDRREKEGGVCDWVRDLEGQRVGAVVSVERRVLRDVVWRLGLPSVWNVEDGVSCLGRASPFLRIQIVFSLEPGSSRACLFTAPCIHQAFCRLALAWIYCSVSGVRGRRKVVKGRRTQRVLVRRDTAVNEFQLLHIWRLGSTPGRGEQTKREEEKRRKIELTPGRPDEIAGYLILSPLPQPNGDQPASALAAPSLFPLYLHLSVCSAPLVWLNAPRERPSSTGSDETCSLTALGFDDGGVPGDCVGWWTALACSIEHLSLSRVRLHPEELLRVCEDTFFYLCKPLSTP
ncbi:hypothetical protein NMY22_g18583 [Coprinellus aureogranulatus]|nr:hypothetical protein NMY22_g18583 [Coprinellus aureogranulatus]